MSEERKVVVPSPHPVAIKEIQLIDRVEEMQILREAADRALHGEGNVVFLYGEAGIGKTRLARELVAYARSRGMQVLYGRCPALFRMDGVPPYVLWREVIKDYLEYCAPEQLYRVIGFYPVEVSKLVPELQQKLRTFPEAFPLSPQHSRDRLFEAVSQFITNISKETPLLVVLDDLQWTDQSSLLLLHYLARGVYRESLLLLGAYRDAYIDEQHPLTSVVTELNRERLLRSVPLKRLSFDDVAEMMKRILEDDEVSKEFCQLVYEKTRGNPFFVEEVIKSLKEEEVITRKEKKWEIKEVSRIEFPETVKSVVRNRISRLDEETQRVLTTASFVGKDFTFDALHKVVGVEEEKLLEIMEKLLKTGLIKQSVIHGEDVCSFADVIVRDALYEEVSPLRRKRLHGVVAQALEKLYAENVDEHLGELALHFLESGDKDKALDYFLKAGDKAASIFANSEATSYLQSALNLLEGRDDKLREKGHVLESLGDINEIVAEYKDSQRFFNEALLLWQQLDEKRKVANVHRKIATLFWSVDGNVERAKEHYDGALRILVTEPESVELARLFLSVAGMYFQTGYMTDALSWAEKSLELSKKLEEFRILGRSYSLLAAVFMGKGDTRKACECAEKALKISLDNNYAENAIGAYNNLAATLSVEESERRLECFEKAYELAKKVGIIGSISWLGSSLAYSYAVMGDIEEALRLAEESVALDRKANDLLNLSLSLEALGFTYYALGEWNKSEQCYKEALINAEKAHSFQTAAYGNGALGVLHFDKGEYAKARECFEKMYQVLEKAGAKPPPVFHVYFAFYNALTYVKLGEMEKAKTLIDEMQESATQAKDKGLNTSADLLRAIIFRAERKWGESLKLFEKGLHELEASDARRWSAYWFANVLCEHARVYLERDQEGDGEKAYTLLDQALEIYQKMGAKKNIEKVRSEIIQLQTRRRQMAPEPELMPTITAVTSEHITTGYTDLDDLLFGGIPKNYAVVLTSPSCDERDLLTKKFLKAGTKKDEVTFYITTNPGEAKTVAEQIPNFYLFICNPQADKMVRDMPNVFKLTGVENLNDISITLNLAFRKLEKMPSEPRRICIEIVSDVLLQHHAMQTRRWLTALIPELKSKGFTLLAVMNPKMHPLEESHAILDLFEGEIHIYEKKTEEGLAKFLKIKKMTNQRYSKSEVSLQEERLRE